MLFLFFSFNLYIFENKIFSKISTKIAIKKTPSFAGVFDDNTSYV